MENRKLSRADRRRAMRQEGRTSQWIRKPSPKELKQGTGWFAEIDRVWINDKYCVMARKVTAEWGTIDHVCIRNVGSIDIPWREKQKIKNELFGKELTAIEVFPAESDLVDEANMYHLWVLPKDFKLPFGLK